jgi:hypothetical protein
MKEYPTPGVSGMLPVKKCKIIARIVLTVNLSCLPSW